MYDLSVIIPYCGSHPYLASALQSLRERMTGSYEVILIDDSGQDKLRAEWFEGLEVSVIVHDTPLGPSSSRNEGLKAAKGQFIAFLDSDDTISRNLMGLADHAGIADIVSGQMAGKAPIPILREQVSPGRDINAQDVPALMKLKHFTTNLYRTDFLKQHDIWFPEDIRYGEDLVFLSKALLAASRVRLTDYDFYVYRKHQTSLVSKMNMAERLNALPRLVGHMQSACSGGGLAGKICLLRFLMFHGRMLQKNQALVSAEDYNTILGTIRLHFRELGALSEVSALSQDFRIPFDLSFY